MNLRKWKRLDAVETLLQIQHHQFVRAIRGENETDAEFDAKIERWKSGETVEGIDAEYKGGEVDIFAIVFVSTKPRATDLRL